MDFTSAIADRTGVGTYTRELCRALLAAIRPEELGLAVNVFRHPGWHRRMKEVLAGAPGNWRPRPNRLLPHGFLLEAERLAPIPWGEALFGPFDLFHGTNFLAPPGRRAKTVVTVHDLAFLRHPEEALVAHRYRRYLRRAMERTDHAIAVSECTKRDLMDLLGMPEDRVSVVAEGAPESLPAGPLPPGLPERFLLFVGTLEPRKNLVRLLRAFGRARLPEGVGLVLAGRPGWHHAEILAGIRRTPGVTWLGFVPEETRNALLAAATALVYPSIYEGFGLPVLEAFAAGTPVITSNAPALPETAGDAAVLVDPRDVDELAGAMERVVGDRSLRGELALRGKERARRFTWDRAARQTLEVYHRVL